MNNSEILGEEAAVRQIVGDDFSATDGYFEDDSIIDVNRSYILASCTTLKNLYLPNLLRAGSSFLRSCSNIETVYLPKAKEIGTYVCAYNNSTEGKGVTIVLPSIEQTGTGDMFRATNINCVDFGEGLSSLQNRALGYDRRVLKIIFRKKDGIVTLASSGALTFDNNSHPVRYIYVPSALISTYAAATNWVDKLADSRNVMLPIEGSEYEYYYANGVPIE